MKLSVLCALILMCGAGTALGTVRVGTRAGKRVIYNDGVGESSREALGRSDSWLAARVATPSLFDDLIAQAAQTSSIDPKRVKSVMLIESAFDPRAISRKGARGLMQLMPETAERYGVRNAFDPTENVSGGARHLESVRGVVPRY